MQRDARKALVELLAVGLHPTAGGIDQHGSAAFEALQHDEVVQVPVQNQRQGRGLELVYVELHAAALKAHALRGLQQLQSRVTVA